MEQPNRTSESFRLSADTVSRLRQGDAVAIAHFLAMIRPPLRRMLNNRLNPLVQPRLDASDIVQETLLRVTAGLENYLSNPPVPPAVWVRLVGKQVAAEMHRAQFRGKRDPTREIDWDSACGDSIVNRVADSMHEAWREASLDEIRKQVRERIQGMPTLDREILELRHVEEYTLREIADLLMISLEAAKKRYQRALKRFQTQIQALQLEESNSSFGSL